MIYKLEKRGTGLAVPSNIYNFMLESHIQYKYDFEKGGIELSENDYSVLQNYKPKVINEPVVEKPVFKKPAKAVKAVKRKLF